MIDYERALKSVAVLMTCHNRKDKSIACLDNLFASILPEGIRLEVYLTDDGSTDGTGAAVRARFPQVHVLEGDGQLFWNRGMKLAWDAAAKDGHGYFLWLNDDTNLEPDALRRLLAVHLNLKAPAILCGATCSSNDRQKLTYGGHRLGVKMLPLSDEVQPCEFFNGNCVLVPNSVYDLVGGLDPIFSHSVGDFDYGVRARKAGVSLWVLPGLVGTCEAHAQEPKWCRPEGTLLSRIKCLYGPLGCHPGEFFVFDRRQNGLAPALWHFVTLHLRAMAPRLWTLKG